MAHDLKIGVLVAVTFLTAIGAAAAYRQSVQPSWQLVEMLPLGGVENSGDGFTPPPPALFPAKVEKLPAKDLTKPSMPAKSPSESKSAAANPFDVPAKKSIEPTKPAPLPKVVFPEAKSPPALDPIAPPQKSEQAVPSKPTSALLAMPPPPAMSKSAEPEMKANENSRQSIAKSKPVERPREAERIPTLEAAELATPVKDKAKVIALESQGNRIDKPSGGIIPAPSPPYRAQSTEISVPSIQPSVTSSRDQAQRNPSRDPSTEYPAPSTQSQAAEADGRVVARSRQASRDVEKTMKRPPEQTPRLIAASSATKPFAPSDSSNGSKANRGLPIAAAKGEPESGAIPAIPIARRVDAAVQPAGFNVVGSENRSEEFIPVKKRTDDWSAIRKTSDNGTTVNNDVRTASWDSPGPPMRASAAPLNTATVAIRSYDAELYVVLDGDSYDRIAESMYRRKDLGIELARYNRSRLNSTEALPTASRVLIPPIGVLTRDRPKTEMASAAGAGRDDLRTPANLVSKDAGPTSLIPAAPARTPNAAGDFGPPSLDPKDRVGSIPVAKPAAGTPQPLLANVSKTSERGIDPPPPTMREPTANVRRESPPIGANRDIRPAAASVPNGGGPTYTVQQSDETLYGIARRMLNDGRRFREIYELNSDKLANEYDLPVGVVLKLPADAIRR